MSTENGDEWYSGLGRRSFTFGRLLDLYEFASTYEAWDLHLAVMLHIQRLVDLADLPPGPTVVNRAIERLGMQSTLCLFLIDCYGNSERVRDFSQKSVSTLPREFLGEVQLIGWKKWKRIHHNHCCKDWCVYHQHHTKEEEQQCRKNRPDDPDVERLRELEAAMRPRTMQTARKSAPSKDNRIVYW